MTRPALILCILAALAPATLATQVSTGKAPPVDPGIGKGGGPGGVITCPPGPGVEGGPPTSGTEGVPCPPEPRQKKKGAPPGICEPTGTHTGPGGLRGASGRAGSLASTPGPFTSLEGTADWMKWWELAKVEFLRPNRLASPATAPRTLGRRYVISGLDPATLAVQRGRLMPLVALHLQDEQAEVRAAAALAVGRLASTSAAGIPLDRGKGPELVAALDLLLPLLQDESIAVRESAILALGATGALAAAPTLLHLAAEDGESQARRSGVAQEAVDADLSPFARELAFTALGLGRRGALPPFIDGLVADLVWLLPADETDAIGTAALVYDALAGGEALRPFALEVSADQDAPLQVRCRAFESLGLLADGALLGRLTMALEHDQLAVRRTAALALGTLEHPQALDALVAAYGEESEELARGFTLVSIGRQGGQGARDFLLRRLRDGDSSIQSWAALGLGLLVREHADPAAAMVLREARQDEAHRDTAQAILLACGLAGDADALPLLIEQLTDDGDQAGRAIAASGLALLGGAEAHEALRARLEVETTPFAQGALAQALGVFGDARDAALLVATLQDMSSPYDRAQVAGALGYLGARQAADALLTVAEDDATDPQARAAALDALALLLDDEPGLVLADVAAIGNFPVLPGWLAGVIGSTTL